MKERTVTNEAELRHHMREMVAYVMDTKDNEVIDGYTDTFVSIAKEYSKN